MLLNLLVLAGIVANEWNGHGCPKNYVLVGSNPNVGVYKTFCIAKYEARKSGSIAKSTARGKPWVNVSYREAKLACRLNGDYYDIVSNKHWQATARELEKFGWNWTWNFVDDQPYEEERINRGLVYLDKKAGAQSLGRDDQPCYKTGHTCADVPWHMHKRVHKLERMLDVWDLSGNVWEWTQADIVSGYKSQFVYAIKDKYYAEHFGSVTEQHNVDKGLGYFWDAGKKGKTYNPVRGGDFASGDKGGIYATYLGHEDNYRASNLGFRCMYGY